MPRTIVWFRRDLRLADHEPLYRAASRGEVIPVFVLDQALLHHPETAPARVKFMLDCLRSLDQDLRDRGGRLILRSGDPVQVLPRLIRESGADGIYAHIDFERIYGRVRDARLNGALQQEQMRIRWFEPQGSIAELIPYPKYRDLWYSQMRSPLIPTPEEVTVPGDIFSLPLPDLAQLGHTDDGKPIPPGGTTAARKLLQDFLVEKSDRYYWQLSYPSAAATTGLSPHIKFGAISTRECYQRAQQLKDSQDPRVERSRKQLISRLRWGQGFTQRFRYLPQLELRSLYTVFDDDGWTFDEELYQAWQSGHTGFAIIDAAARCLLATGGWQDLNFRSRAMYASFLGNLLGIDWRYGALHFMRHLIDGDCPIDHYQWAMQTGVTHCVDKTWTRIYNPEQTAVDRCDPEGEFIHRWVPELKLVGPKFLGSPPPISGYPRPIVHYKQARQQRVKTLEQQRAQFLGQSNLVPFLARMPQDWTPFGCDRVPSRVEWAQGADAMFPGALDLDQLDPTQAEALRTWFVAHVNVIPPNVKQRNRKNTSSQSQGNQLNLFD
jgi:deoxyribodipyrimidine photo-lyase